MEPEKQSCKANLVPGESAGGLRYLARQPILDTRGRVHGYELLFRSGPETVFRGDGDHATRTMLDNAVMFGLDKLTAGLPAFVNCTREALTDQLVDVLPPSMTVLEILENLDPTPELIASCRQLKAAGYRLALDDFVWREGMDELVEIADYIKVDMSVVGSEERRGLLEQLQNKPVVLVAERVETQQDYQQVLSEGFSLFQGYYFCRPMLFKNRNIPPNRLFHFQILQLLQRSPTDLRKLSDLLKKDTSITYRLMRLVNSPVCAMRQEIRSIETALIAVGEDAFRRIATLAIASDLNGDQPMELLRMAFVRGRFCELTAGLCGLDPMEQYLLGMLSLVPAMMKISVEDLAPSLPLRESVQDALLGKDVRERCLLHWLECNERGDWKGCDELIQHYGLQGEEIIHCYEEALVWAEEAISSV
jgi:EAL and modified HD-GYP domain-containing signal transduction protein